MMIQVLLSIPYFMFSILFSGVEIDNSFPDKQNRLVEVTNEKELKEAIDDAQPGDSIFVYSGTYKLDERIFINDSGKEDQYIYLIGDTRGERPLLDYSSLEENSSNQGMVLKANYWHVKGLRYFKAGDNGLHVRGSHNIIEFCSFFENADTGLQLDDGASSNLILNCDSYYNADSKLENADGYAVKMDVGSGNRFVGCRAWNNLDDGWDGYLREANEITTYYENCWAFNNGYLKNGKKGKGDGNGFKTGGSDNKDKKHNANFTRCLAVNNVNDGFDHNSNRGTVIILNGTTYNNGRNLAFSQKVGLTHLIVINTVAIGDEGSVKGDILIESNNSWNDGFSVSPGDFESLDSDELSSKRKKDGSLPDIMSFRPKGDSKLIDRGKDIGIMFSGKNPDLGAFEVRD